MFGDLSLVQYIECSKNYGDSIKISGFHGLRGRKDELVENREILGQ